MGGLTLCRWLIVETIPVQLFVDHPLTTNKATCVQRYGSVNVIHKNVVLDKSQ